jgi:hypothetical protein
MSRCPLCAASDIRDPWSCGSITSSNLRTWYALTVENRFPNLWAPGTPEGLCRLCRGFEGGECLFSCHSNCCLNVRQTASPRRSQYRRSCSLLVRELTNGQPVVVTKCQIPRDEPTSYALEELGDSFLTIFWLSRCLLFSRKRTLLSAIAMSALCQKQRRSKDQVIGSLGQRSIFSSFTDLPENGSVRVLKYSDSILA